MASYYRAETREDSMGSSRTDEEFDAFVRSSFARLTRTGYLLCGDWHKAEDAAQAAVPYEEAPR